MSDQSFSNEFEFLEISQEQKTFLSAFFAYLLRLGEAERNRRTELFALLGREEKPEAGRKSEIESLDELGDWLNQSPQFRADFASRFTAACQKAEKRLEAVADSSLTEEPRPTKETFQNAKSVGLADSDVSNTDYMDLLIFCQELYLLGLGLNEFLTVEARFALERLLETSGAAVLRDEADQSILADYLSGHPIPDELLLPPFSDTLTDSDYELLAVCNPQRVPLSDKAEPPNRAPVRDRGASVQVVALDEYGEGVWQSGESRLSFKRLEDLPTQLSILISGSFSHAVQKVRIGTVEAEKSPTEQGIWRADFSAYLPSARLTMQQAPISVWLNEVEYGEINEKNVDKKQIDVCQVDKKNVDGYADHKKEVGKTTVSSEGGPVQFLLLPPLLTATFQEYRGETDDLPWLFAAGRNQYSYLSAFRYPESIQPRPECRELPLSVPFAWDVPDELEKETCSRTRTGSAARPEGGLNPVQAIPIWKFDSELASERILQIQFVGLERLACPKLFCRFFGRIQAVSAEHPTLFLSETRFESISDYRQSALQIGLVSTGPFVPAAVNAQIAKGSLTVIKSNLVGSFSVTDNGCGLIAPKTRIEAAPSEPVSSDPIRNSSEAARNSSDLARNKPESAPSGLSESNSESATQSWRQDETARSSSPMNQEDWFFQPTAEQQEALDNMGAIPRLMITGSAGTGKTMLGFYQAQKFARAGKLTLFICYNRNLAKWLAQRVPDELRGRLTVLNFHALCFDFATRAGLDFNPSDNGAKEEFWQIRASELLRESLACSANPRFDAIILDEAQDFRQNWLESLNLLLTDSRAPLYTFCDPRQNLFQIQTQEQSLEMIRRWLFADRSIKLECSLVQNCRNVRNVARYSGRIIGQELESMSGMKDGPEVFVYQAADAVERRFMANQIIQEQLLRSVKPSSMAILSHRTRKNSSLGAINQMAGVPITEDLDAWQRNGGILYSSIRRFKGLEADNILLLDVGPCEAASERDFSRQEMYTGCTRARQTLTVLARPDADPLILA